MTSAQIRDPKSDHLLTPDNCALLIIDYQPVQVGSIRSMDRKHMVDNIVRVVRIAKAYRLPTIVSTVNVKTGVNKPTIPELRTALGDGPEYDRTQINAWEDVEFQAAVRAAGRKKLLMAALWTEACLTFPTLDALREGFEVYPIADAVGGTSLEAHSLALERMQQAGAKLTSWVQLICELQRDWARTTTVPDFRSILFQSGAAFVEH